MPIKVNRYDIRERVAYADCKKSDSHGHQYLLLLLLFIFRVVGHGYSTLQYIDTVPRSSAFAGSS